MRAYKSSNNAARGHLEATWLEKTVRGNSGRSFGWSNKFVILFGSKSSCWRRLFTLLDFGSLLKIASIVGKSLARPVGVFPMQPNPSRFNIQQQNTQFEKHNLKSLGSPPRTIRRNCKWIKMGFIWGFNHESRDRCKSTDCAKWAITRTDRNTNWLLRRIDLPWAQRSSSRTCIDSSRMCLYWATT
jgi:hypothetical protein